VVLQDDDRVREIQVKQRDAASNWIWGAFKMPGIVFDALRRLWYDRDRQDEYFGTLVNAYLAGGGDAVGIKAGQAYVDVGTLHGYRAAVGLLAQDQDDAGINSGSLPLRAPTTIPSAA
jgi:glucose-1-phosphate thymidylyltransferase